MPFGSERVEAGIGLALSGVGFAPAYFSLNELGYLPQIKRFSAVLTAQLRLELWRPVGASFNSTTAGTHAVDDERTQVGGESSASAHSTSRQSSRDCSDRSSGSAMCPRMNSMTCSRRRRSTICTSFAPRSIGGFGTRLAGQGAPGRSNHSYRPLRACRLGCPSE